MKIPPYIQSGDTIGIVATARKISPAEIQPAVRMLESWGLKVKLGTHLFNEDNQYAGTDRERTEDLQSMLDDNSIRAILCARGGYGTVRIIDEIDFSNFRNNPKWIIGYSDVTVLHSHIHTCLGIETMHAAMPLDFIGKETEATYSLRKALFGESLDYTVSGHPLNRLGECSAQIVGGNLSILYSLRGTVSDVDTDGKILFIEDLDEYLYHIDRMMMNLKRGGKLKSLKGLVVGGMTDMHDNTIPFGKTAQEIIMDAVKEYDYPICFDFPAGHLKGENRAIILGGEVRLSVSTKGVTLRF